MKNDPSLTGLPLSVSADEAAAQFDLLQRKLGPLWRSIECFNQDEQTIVVVPSISLEMAVTGFEVQGYEERFLFLLLLLAQPRARLIYVTSQAIHPSVVEYYLGLLPGVIHSHAMRRLTLLSPYDDTARPLSLKLLERPRLLERIEAGIQDKDRAHLVCYNTTYLERNLALRLGIPLYGADPRHFSFGTKTGCRQLFAQAGINHPLGFDNLSSIDEVVAALTRMREQRPSMVEAVVKLNEGVSGEGNAMVDLSNLGPAASTAIAERVRAMRFEKPRHPPRGVLPKNFAIAAEWLRSASGLARRKCAARACNCGSPRWGMWNCSRPTIKCSAGPSGQSYLGCIFPADPGYASAITRDAAKVGDLLRDAGVIGRFALDFVVTRANESAAWETYAIEINLRKGGTTHPFLTLQFLTGGSYDAASATFTAPNGRQKFLVASDHLDSPLYRGYTPDDLFDLVVRRGLAFWSNSADGRRLPYAQRPGQHGPSRPDRGRQFTRGSAHDFRPRPERSGRGGSFRRVVAPLIRQAVSETTGSSSSGSAGTSSSGAGSIATMA